MKFIRITEHSEAHKKHKSLNFKEENKAHLAWLEGEKKAGKLLDVYILGGKKNGSVNIAIWDFSTPEEIDKCTCDDPIGYSFKPAEVYPAVDLFAHIRNYDDCEWYATEKTNYV